MRYFILALSILATFDASAQTRFKRFYNFSPDTTMIASAALSAVTDTTNLIITGNTINPTTGLLMSYLADFDYNGNLKWKKLLPFNDRFNGITGRLALTTYALNKSVVAGAFFDPDTTINLYIHRPYLYFFDHQGNFIRTSSYADSSRIMNINALITDTTSSIVGVGIKTSNKYADYGGGYTPESIAIWIIKLDTLGNIIWQKSLMELPSYPNFISNTANSVTLSADKKHYVVSGYSWDSALNTPNNFILKTDLNGNLVWRKWLPIKYVSWNYAHVTSLRNGGYIFCSSIANAPSTQPPPFEAVEDLYGYYGKINEAGDTLWTRKARFIDSQGLEGQKVIERQNGHLLFLTTASYCGGYPLIFETDSSGNILYYREYLWTPYRCANQEAFSMDETPNKQIFVSGCLGNDDPVPEYDTAGEITALMLSDSLGCLQPGCSKLSVKPPADQLGDRAVVIYPNPAFDELNIHIYPGKHATSVMITDIAGKTLMRSEIKADRSTLDISQFANGIYFVRVMDGSRMLLSEKISKQ